MNNAKNMVRFMAWINGQDVTETRDTIIAGGRKFWFTHDGQDILKVADIKQRRSEK